MLELGLEEPGHFHGRAGRARDAHAGQIVGLEDLLDAAVRDLVALAGLPVAGHDHPVAVAEREDGGAVRHRGHPALLGGRLGAPGEEMGRGALKDLGKA